MEQKIFDNSNIAESYSGVVTPLTFSFVRFAYEGVYQHFSRMMGVSKTVIKANDEVFQHMVALVGCRVYYNLRNWYKMLTLFPGYQFSAGLMEKMMGVEKNLPITSDTPKSVLVKYGVYLPKTITHTFFIVITFATLGYRTRVFRSYFERTFATLRSVDLELLSLPELKMAFFEADTKLISHWRVPIANDFAVMISTGLADRLFRRWLSDEGSYEYMRVVTDMKKKLVSLDPGNKLFEIVALIQKDEAIKTLFMRCDAVCVYEQLQTRFLDTVVTKQINGYLIKFGARMPNELKLESETLTERPETLIALIQKRLEAGVGVEREPKKVDENTLWKQLSLYKRLTLRWLLRWSVASIERREESRFFRTLVFGHVRAIFTAIGKKWEAGGILRTHRDIFYLTIEEVFSVIDKSDQAVCLQTKIEKRKRKLETWEAVELPRRIETTKTIEQVESDMHAKRPVARSVSQMSQGRVASRPGGVETVRGVALTLETFDPTADFTDKILITKQTDPGWTVVFPLVKAIVVERGGMLSHAAIVARELGIPCVVGVERATQSFQDTTTIEIDMSNGKVTQGTV